MKSRNILFFLIILVSSFAIVFFRANAESDDDYKSSKPKTVTQTVVVTPARTVTEDQVQTITLPDRDSDGIADSEDPYPDVAEIYIVKDDNLNGIVDTFEYGK